MLSVKLLDVNKVSLQNSSVNYIYIAVVIQIARGSSEGYGCVVGVIEGNGLVAVDECTCGVAFYAVKSVLERDGVIGYQRIALACFTEYHAGVEDLTGLLINVVYVELIEGGLDSALFKCALFYSDDS